MVIPKKLQSLFWSVDIKRLELKKDKSYIIHQILAYGNLDDFKWLFKVYPKRIIVNTFLHHPYKDYRESRFYFVKNQILGLEKKKINKNQYVKNILRDIR